MSQTKRQQTLSPRLDYSELVVSLLNGEKRRAEKLMQELLPKLQEYLRVVMGADKESAEECSQQAFMNVYEHIMANKIKVPKYILSYLLRACKNEYIRYQNNERRYLNNEEPINQMVEPAKQIQSLVDEERQQILRECLDELDPESREFIIYFIKNPDASTEEASNHFDLTGGNVRTKKSRLTKQLHKLYKQKSKKANQI
jgi:RNA polymerase sigma factor (sigma-70 family)